MKMNETNGKIESNAPLRVINESREKLDLWEATLGLPSKTYEVEATKYLEMGYNDRSKLTNEECYEAALTLNRYSLYIARLSNQLEAEVNILDSQISRAICERIEQQQSYDKENKRMLAIKDNDVASKQYNEKIATQSRARRLYYLSMRIEKIADSFEQLGNSRRRSK